LCLAVEAGWRPLLGHKGGRGGEDVHRDGA